MLACCVDRERHVVYDDLLLASVLRAQPIGLCRVKAEGREVLKCRWEDEHLRSADKFQPGCLAATWILMSGFARRSSIVYIES